MGTVNNYLRTEDRLRAIGVLATAPHLAQLFERYDAPFIHADVTFNPAVGHFEAVAHHVAKEIGCTPDDALMMLIYAIVQRWAEEPERPISADLLGRTRSVELYRLWPAGERDRGSWDTAYEHIPINTPKSKVGEVAIITHRVYLKRLGQDVIDIGVYSIPSLDEEMEIEQEPTGIFVALRNPTHFAAMLATARAHLDDLGIILHESDRSETVAAEQLLDTIRETTARAIDEWATRTLDAKLMMLGWLLVNLEVKDAYFSVREPAALTGAALHDHTVALVRLDVEAAQER